LLAFGSNLGFLPIFFVLYKLKPEWAIVEILQIVINAFLVGWSAPVLSMIQNCAPAGTNGSAMSLYLVF
jgi:hypothetical protein